MNIRTENVEALLRQQEAAAKKASPGTGAGFDALLAKQMELASGQPTSPTIPPPGIQSHLISQMMLTHAEKTSATADPVEQVMRQAFDQASGALDMWDSYVSILGKPGEEANLRDAYALLQGLDTKVSGLKQDAQPVLGQNPNLATLINELAVMTATEKFKMNRGDYS